MPGGPGGCVADPEHITESTGSTSQQWSTNSGAQPLTISCGFPVPYLAISIRGPRAFDALGSASLLSLKAPPIGGLGDVLSKAVLRRLRVLQINIGV